MYAIFTQYTKTAIKNHVFGKNFEKKKQKGVNNKKKNRCKYWGLNRIGDNLATKQ